MMIKPFNKEHIQIILKYVWNDEFRHFDELYQISQDYPDVLTTGYFEDPKNIGKMLSLNHKFGRTDHVFHTLLELKFMSL